MKKAILKITVAIVFSLMVIFNISTSVNSTDFSLGGPKALANGTNPGSECYYSYCDDYTNTCKSNYNATNCAGPGGAEPCSDTWNCY